MRLRVQILALAAALLALVLWERSLSAGASRDRRASIRVGRLVSSETAEEIQRRTAAVRVASGDLAWLYINTPTGWRILGYHGAPALGAQIESLATSLREAEGVVQSRDETRFPDYGIGTSASQRVTFHGSDFVRTRPDGSQEFVGDPIYEVEVGAPVPGQDGCYAQVLLPRPAEEDRGVWAVDSSPIELLAAPRQGLPSMLDPYLLPRCWFASGAHLERIEVQHPDSAFALALEARELTEEQLRARERTHDWVLQLNGQPMPFESALTTTYSYFLQRAPFLAILDPASIEPEALHPERSTRIVLTAAESAPLRLTLGPPRADGTRVCHNSQTGCYYQLGPQVCQLLAPRFGAFSAGASANPWEDFMQPPR